MWDANTESNLAGYNIGRNIGRYGGRLNRVLLGRTTITDSTLQPGHTFFYVVTAVAKDRTERADRMK